MVPVVEVGGRLSFHGDGPTHDYAVKMRRLDDSHNASEHPVENRPCQPAVFWPALSQRLAQFYAEAATGEGVNEFGSLPVVWHNIEENLEQSVAVRRQHVAASISSN